MPSDDTPWTVQDIALLSAMWSDDANSAATIAARLKRSKNSVVGKAKRLKLPGRPSPIVQDAPDAGPRIRRAGANTLPAAAATETAGDAEPTPPVAAPADPAPRAAARICCWPVEETRRGVFLFCGVPVFRGKPYCPAHCAKAYVTPPRAGPAPVYAP